jgi:hypothetical protein
LSFHLQGFSMTNERLARHRLPNRVHFLLRHPLSHVWLHAFNSKSLVRDSSTVGANLTPI